jgi:hypothetical protein
VLKQRFTPDPPAAGPAVLPLRTPNDDALKVSIIDVRNKSSLTDCMGNVQAQIPMRVTDQCNGSSATDSATVSDFVFPFTVPGTATADATVGSTRAVNTTASTVLPGMVTPGYRQVIGLGRGRDFRWWGRRECRHSRKHALCLAGLFNP